jgi:predicted small secreted protein
MIRIAALAVVLAGMVMSMTACTNTVRGLGADLNSPTIQDYNNNRTATNLDY